jgi:hypothetical protein
MGLNFRRSIKVAPGVRISLSKKGVGVSAGIRGARISKSATGRTTVSAGIPGSGLSYRKTIKNKSKKDLGLNRPNNANVNHMNDLQHASPAVEREIVLEPRTPKKFWTGFWFVSALGSIGVDFEKTTPNGPSRLSSIIFSLFPIGILLYRIFRHKNPRMRKVVRIMDGNY